MYSSMLIIEEKDASVTLPPGGRFHSDFTFIKLLNKTSAHEVSLYHKITPPQLNEKNELLAPGRLEVFFYKENRRLHKKNSGVRPAIKSFISNAMELIVTNGKRELRPAVESFISDAMGLIVTCAPTCVVYDDLGQSIGVFSKAIPDFRPAARCPLEELELRLEIPPALADAGYQEMEALDQKITALEEKRHALAEQNAWLDWADAQLKEEKNDDLNLGRITIKPGSDEARRLRKQFPTYKKENKEQDLGLEEEIFNLYKEINKKCAVEHPRALLKNYRMRKGLAQIIVAWLKYEEGDGHLNNFSIDEHGKCALFDFDMSLWLILFYFKKSILKYWRIPTRTMFRLSTAEILTLPLLGPAAPYYWLGNNMPIFSSQHTRCLKEMLNLTENGYSNDHIKIFQRLATDPVFIYHKYASFLISLLITPEIHKYFLAQHLGEHDATSELTTRIMKNRAKSYEALKNSLLCIPDFHEFMRMHGENTKNIFLQKIREKIPASSREMETQAVILLSIEKEYAELQEKTAQLENDPDFIMVDSEQTKADNTDHDPDKLFRKLFEAVPENQLYTMLNVLEKHFNPNKNKSIFTNLYGIFSSSATAVEKNKEQENIVALIQKLRLHHRQHPDDPSVWIETLLQLQKALPANTHLPRHEYENIMQTLQKLIRIYQYNSLEKDDEFRFEEDSEFGFLTVSFSLSEAGITETPLSPPLKLNLA